MANNNMYAILYARAIEYFTNHYVLILWMQTCFFCSRLRRRRRRWFPFSFGSRRLGADYLHTNNKSKQIQLKQKQTYRSMKKVSTMRMEWMGWHTSGVSQETKVMHTFDGNFHSSADIPWKNMKIANIACGRMGRLFVHKWISEQVIQAGCLHVFIASALNI